MNMITCILHFFRATLVALSVMVMPASAQTDAVKIFGNLLYSQQVSTAEREKKIREVNPGLKALELVLCPIRSGELQRLKTEDSLTELSLTDVQTALQFFGHNPGALDGLAGPTTRQATETYAKELYGPKRSCLTLREADKLVRAHRWSLELTPELRADIVAEHGSIGMLRSYYGRNLPSPEVATPPEQDRCMAHDNADRLGEIFTDDLRDDTGASELRVFRILTPGTVTMDIRYARLNLHLDGFDRVYLIRCG